MLCVLDGIAKKLSWLVIWVRAPMGILSALPKLFRERFDRHHKDSPGMIENRSTNSPSFLGEGSAFGGCHGTSSKGSRQSGMRLHVSNVVES